MTDYKIERLKYLNELPGRYDSRKYLKWAKQKYPNFDLHHILQKRCDYLIYPVEHWHHLNVIEKHKAKYFCKFLELSVLILQEYLIELTGEGFELKDFSPSELIKLFNKVKENE